MLSSKVARNGWSLEGFLKKPAFAQSFVKQRATYSGVVSPLRHRARHSVVGDVHVGGSVVALLFGRGPAAISLLVVTVVVFSVKLMFGRRASAHVGYEVVEQHPSFANLDASSAVPAVHAGFGICASSFHRAPNAILRRIRLAMAKAVSLAEMTNGLHVFCRALAVKASATANDARSKLADVQRVLVAAVAKTQHKTFSRDGFPDYGLDRKPAGLQPNQLFIFNAIHT